MSHEKDTSTMSSQNDTANTWASRFSIFSFSRDKEMAEVKVGKGSLQQTFHLHKALLSRASNYFDRALNGNFKESVGLLTLEHHCPIAFEAVCWWVYGGQEMDAKHFETCKEISKYYYQLQDNWQQLFYLRLLKLADETMIPSLRVHAYESLTKNFFAEPPAAMPETNFLRELFDSDVPVALLEEYLVDYAGWAISQKACIDPREWSKALLHVPKYGLRVVSVIALASGSMVGNLTIEHPANNPRYGSQSFGGVSQTSRD